MKKIILSVLFSYIGFNGFAQEVVQDTVVTEEKIKGNFFGGFESNSQWYTNDVNREISHPEDPIRSNNYLSLNYNYGKWTAGIQGESYTPKALLNYNPKFEKTNVATYYVNYKSTKLDVTAGYFYEQFGSGLLLRSWEDRSLGINNALRGGKINYKPNEDISLTALYGRHRSGFDVSGGDVFGFDSDINLFNLLNIEEYKLSVGFSYVGRNEKTYIVDPKFDELTNAYAGRINFAKGNFYMNTEYNFKSKDGILYDSKTVSNEFVKPGSALLMNFGYSKKNLGVDVSLRRMENMSFYSEREPEMLAPEQSSIYFSDKLMNFIPSLTKQHHFSLANIYVYQAQARTYLDPTTDIGKAGEIGGQIDLFYNFEKESALGGKYGTKVAINASNWNNLKGDYTLFPPDYKLDFLAGSQKYFSDASLEITKKLSPKLSSNFTYVNQYFNNRYIAGAANVIVKTNIVAAELDYKFKNSRTAKIALEHMWADSDRKNWAALLIEYNLNSKFSVFASDMYNYGYDEESDLIDDQTDRFKIHFYNVGGSFKKNNHRVSLNYGRQRGGLVCAGGVCRFVPPSTGLSLSFTTSF